MFKNSSLVVSIAVAALCVAGMSSPQAQQADRPPMMVQKPVVPLRVVVTMSRFQGERKIASMPFELIVSANEFNRSIAGAPATALVWNYLRTTQLRVGVDVAAGTETTTSSAGVTSSRPTYRYVGTNIDSAAYSEDGGRFRIYVSIDDSSLFTADPNSPGVLRVGEPAAFRSLTYSNRVSVKEGQTVNIVTATDRLSGDLVKVDVIATVIK